VQAAPDVDCLAPASRTYAYQQGVEVESMSPWVWFFLSLVVIGPFFTWWLARKCFGRGKP
jgi:hypothetical protein